ncbi:MAG: HEAT repeat domain-containing protein [Gemmatales bacterium]|nr:HEAT repeat domain-containing protein [Gemmatales bacterium]MDW7995849.1 HEAT repeat domain-containing protein [Gemmatales bacterium]
MHTSKGTLGSWVVQIGLWLAALGCAVESGQAYGQDLDSLELVKRGLQDPDAQIRMAALASLQHQWQSVRTELQAELRGGRKEQVELLLQAQRALAQQAERVADLVLADPNEQVRLRAIETLALLDCDVRQAKIQEAWRVLLESPQQTWGVAAARAWGIRFESLLADLVNPRVETAQSLRLAHRLANDLVTLRDLFRLALSHSEVAVRGETLRVLQDVVRGLVQRLSGWQAQLELPEFRPLGKEIFRDLVQLVEHMRPSLQACLGLPHVQVRQPACQLYETLGDLAHLLEEELMQPEGSDWAKQIRQQLAQSIPDLLAIAVGDRDRQIRLSAWQAVEAIEALSWRTWPALQQGLRDDYAPVRWSAARCMQARKPTQLTLEQRRAMARDLALRLIEEPEVSVRLRLAHSLKSWSSEFLAARHEIAQALESLASPWPGVDFTPFPPAHRQSRRQVRDQDVLLALLTALREFAEQHRRVDQEPLPTEWLQGLILALEAEKPAVRVEVCRIIGYYGAAAYAIRPKLLQLLNDPDPQVRGAAAQAILRVTPPPQ